MAAIVCRAWMMLKRYKCLSLLSFSFMKRIFHISPSIFVIDVGSTNAGRRSVDVDAGRCFLSQT